MECDPDSCAHHFNPLNRVCILCGISQNGNRHDDHPVNPCRELDERLKYLYQNRVIGHACLRQYLSGEVSLEEALIRLVTAQDTQAEAIFKMLRDSAAVR